VVAVPVTLGFVVELVLVPEEAVPEVVVVVVDVPPFSTFPSLTETRPAVPQDKLVATAISAIVFLIVLKIKRMRQSMDIKYKNP
jgi:hypothetical protein